MSQKKKEEIDKSMIKNGMDMIYLAACALQDRIPDSAVVKAMDLSGVYHMAKKHSMVAIACYGLEKWLETPEGKSYEMNQELLAKWVEKKNMAIRKNLMLDMEREKLLAYMEAQQIWYMPLKGSILKDMYPKMGMRQMADNDILIDDEGAQKVHDYMVGRNYEVEAFGKGVHDTYLKKPFYNFEIHRTMIDSSLNEVWKEYYKDVFSRLVKNEGSNWGYHFTDEDFYVYMLAHAYKHYLRCGNGIRHLIDVQVYLEGKPSMDRTYLDRELEHLGIAEYERVSRTLAEKIFGKNPQKPEQYDTILSKEELELLELSIHMGTYGTTANGVKNNLQRFKGEHQLTIWLRLKYMWGRLVNEDGLRFHFPRLSKYKILYPILIVARLVKGLSLRGKNIVVEVKTILKEK